MCGVSPAVNIVCRGGGEGGGEVLLGGSLVAMGVG